MSCNAICAFTGFDPEDIVGGVDGANRDQI
jgi:hypothetical protein